MVPQEYIERSSRTISCAENHLNQPKKHREKGKRDIFFTCLLEVQLFQRTSLESKKPLLSTNVLPKKPHKTNKPTKKLSPSEKRKQHIYMRLQTSSEVHSKFEAVEGEARGNTCYFMSFLKHKIQQKFNSAVKCQIGRSIC